MVKYSVIMPYINRAFQLHNTLISYLHHYKNSDEYEIIIVEDLKNEEWERGNEKKLGDVVYSFNNVLPIKCIKVDIDSYCPVVHYNQGVRESVGEYIVLTGPEIFHVSAVFYGFNQALKAYPNAYVLASCRFLSDPTPWISSVDQLKGGKGIWIQHSKLRPLRQPHCAAISRSVFDEIGGYDDEFKHGIAYEDEELLDRIYKERIQIVEVDSQLTLHQQHNFFEFANFIEAAKQSDKFAKLLEINKQLRLKKKPRHKNNYKTVTM